MNVHSRRARPTLRVIKEDLVAGWLAPDATRAVVDGRLDELHPLSELDHPIIAKAASCFGDDPDDDNPVGIIRDSAVLALHEVKVRQWRGGVWIDPATGVCWLVVAGLAKGGHLDRDDFYQRVARESRTSADWLPVDDDVKLLKRETASRILLRWELEVQAQTFDALGRVHAGGVVSFDVSHPSHDRGPLATVQLTVAPIRDGTHVDDVVVEIVPAESRDRGGPILRSLTLRVLHSLHPPEEDWDVACDIYSNIGEPGAWTGRLDQLRQLVERDELAPSEPGQVGHYEHRRNLANSAADGSAVRALCGVFFVPREDHDDLPACPFCVSTRHAPAGVAAQ